VDTIPGHNVFIIGAGFTKEIFPHAPLNRNLLKALESPNSASSILRKRYNTQDIEIALTRLDATIASLKRNSGQRSKEPKNLRQRIESELGYYFSSEDFQISENLITQSQWITQLIDGAFNPGDVAISLNYDCVLEGVLDCRGKWTPNLGYGDRICNPLACNDSTPQSPVTVLKIHGSANFILDIENNGIIFSFDEYFFPRSAKKKHLVQLPRREGSRKIYIIAPSFVKAPTVEINYLMLDALSALTKAKNLIIIGSSLRPEDSFLTVLITNFFRQPDWSNRKIIVVDPQAEEISKRINDYWQEKISSHILPIKDCLKFAVPRILDAIGD